MTNPTSNDMALQPPVAEAPSGKGAADENFPVGSFLLPKALRPHVAKFYAFARAIDDVADSPDLSSEEKITRLRGFDSALNGDPDFSIGYEKATALRISLEESNVSTKHGSDLIAAFLQDAVKNRYCSWAELIGYCELSANPVGRYLLDLHGEDRSGYRYSDALCTVLQIVNHLQDCADDKASLDRVYIPDDYLSSAGARISDIDADALSPPMRQVLDRMLDGCEALMVDAKKLPRVLTHKSLAMESATIICLADRLITLLRKGDPLATRVALSKLDFAACGVRGVLWGYTAAGKGVAS